jgi:hypothetical protein
MLKQLALTPLKKLLGRMLRNADLQTPAATRLN